MRYILGYPFPKIGGFRLSGMSIGTPWFYGSGGRGAGVNPILLTFKITKTHQFS